MRSSTNTSNLDRSNEQSVPLRPKRRRRKPPEQVHLEREAVLAKKGMRRSYSEFRKTADPLRLVRKYPIGASLVVGGLAAVTAMMITRGRSRGPTEETTIVECTMRDAQARGESVLLRPMGRALAKGLVSLVLSQLLSTPDPAASGNIADES
jgi:hypothetical protein